MNIKDYTTANKEAWNEVMPKHQAAEKDKLDNMFAQRNFIYQKDQNLLTQFEKISLKGKDVAHLCCNNGSELLSIKNMGASRCVGIDICDEAIKEANERATKSNIDCEFICSDVFEIPESLYNSFDIVHITAGCIGWIPDLKLFFKIISKLLRKDGIFLVHEIHPFSEILPFDTVEIDNRLQIIEPYFRTEPIAENSSLDYVGGTQYEAKTQYWFVHTISTIIMSLVENNFKIEEFIESNNDISAGHYKIESLNAEVPLSMIIIAKKI